ncbi:Hpt domain-containing protein [Siccirubricoccus deserti]|uniref:Hpt domain-containing protein n=1 Tax=Siccirubricoccus deserti TaxID=2013562 RepID=UPI0036F1C74E
MYRAAALGRPHVPILGLTADATPAAVARCRDAGMDGCLVKPVEPSRLAAAVLAHARPAPPLAVPPIVSHPCSRQASVPALDLEVRANLTALGGEDFAAGLLQDFLADAEQTTRLLAEAAGAGDAAGFRAAAHALRSSAANIGARGVFEMCAAAEAIAAPEVATLGARQVAMLTAELDRVRRAGDQG